MYRVLNIINTKHQLRRGTGGDGAIATPLNFCMSENLFPKVQNFGLKIPHLGGNLRAKLKF